MEIRLGVVHQTDSGYSTELSDSLSKTEHDNLLSAIDEIHHFENCRRLLEIVIQNSNEFLMTIDSSVKYMLNNSLSMSGDKEEYYKQHLNFNRLFLNYLSSLRTFLDHNEVAIKRKFGKESNEVEKFKNITKNCFDSYFSYRFLYKLRNYSQHIGLPIDEIEISATKQPDETFKGYAKIGFLSETLLEKYDGWGVVKKDLKSKKEISVTPLLNEMSSLLIEFWNSMINIYAGRLFDSVQIIERQAGHLRKENCDVCIFTNIVTDENGRVKYFQTLQIPFDTISTFDFYNKDTTK